MTLAMLALIRVCVQVNKHDLQAVGTSAKERVFSGKTTITQSRQIISHCLLNSQVLPTKKMKNFSVLWQKILFSVNSNRIFKVYSKPKFKEKSRNIAS
jgi:hypothetical protein